MKNPIILTLVLSFALFSCKKKPEPVVPEPVGSVTVNMKHVVDNMDLVLNSSYKTPHGDTIRITKFIYYISNIELVRTDNTTHKVPESYHLVDHSKPATVAIRLDQVPAGTYSGMRYMIGVDSTRNVSGAQSGDLDQAKGMFWSWSTGYIFLKLEGTSNQSGAVNKGVTYHIGGHKGVNKAQRSGVIEFGSTAISVTDGSSSSVNLKVDVNEIFDSPNTLDFSQDYYIMSAGANAKKIADNYADMVSLLEIKN